MFYGQYQSTIDAKSRLALPRQIRDELTNAQVVLGKGFDGALFGFERDSWEAQTAPIVQSSLSDEEARIRRRDVFRSIFVLRVDDQGRIVVPQRLLEVARFGELPQSLTIVGAGDHFEIWQAKAWETYEKQYGE